MGATRRSRLQHAFVIAQVMLTQPLLLLVASAIGGVMMETREPLRSGAQERVLQLRMDLASIPATQQRAAVERVVRRIARGAGRHHRSAAARVAWICDARRSRRRSSPGCIGDRSQDGRGWRWSCRGISI